MNSIGIKRTNLGVRHYKQLRAIFKSLRAGVSITQSCKAAGIDPSCLWLWRKKSNRLDIIINSITDSRVMMVEDALFKKALEGSVAAQVFYTCNRAPDRWHNVADIKNIIYNMPGAQKDEPTDRFKEAPRFIFTAKKLQNE
jgi:hypothetical protein